MAAAAAGRPHRLTLLAALVVVLAGLPFAGSALKIDDPLYLAAARQVLAHPLDPLGAPSYWHDQPGRLFEDFYNPPGIAYVLAPVVALGASESAVHLLMLALAAAALLVLGDVGRRLGAPPALLLAVATSPALAACGVSAMTDVPFLLLTALAWRQAQRGAAPSAGLLVGLGALLKYAGLLNLVPVALLLRDRRRVAIACGPALGLVLAWFAGSAWLYGQPHATVASRYVAFVAADQAEYVASFVAALGLAGAPALLAMLRWDRSSVAVAIVAGCGAGAAFAATGADPVTAAIAAASFASGVALLIAALRASAAAGPFLVAAFWLYALWASAFVYFGTARYLLPLLAPLAWLLERGGRLRLDAWRVASGAALGLAASVVALAADAGYAEAWRQAARRLPAAGRVLHTGRWGFEAYAAAEGRAALRPDEALAAGDVVAEPLGTHTAGPWPAQAARLEPAGEIRVDSPAVRVMDERADAGFYSSAWGLLPFGWRRGAQEVVRLSRLPAWLDATLAAPAAGPVRLDFGSEEARHTLLGGWSYDEADASGRSFVRALGGEAWLRVPLPAGVARLRLRLVAEPAALGPLRIAVGPRAAATVVLQPGWRDYDVPLVGVVEGGPTTLAFRPAGHRRPGRFDTDRRESAYALDGLGFDTAQPGNRGAWAAPYADGVPGIAVSGARLEWTATTTPVHGSLRVVTGEAEIAAGGATLWSGDAAHCGGGCALDLRVAAGTRLVLRADRARLRLAP